MIEKKNFFEDIYCRSSDVMSVALVTIDHPELGKIRIADDNRSHFFDEHEYVPYPFKIDFPDETQDSDGQGRITLANLDDRIIEIVRTGPQDITLRIDAEYLKNGEYEKIIKADFKLSGITVTASSVSAGLVLKNVLTDEFPSLAMTALTCPGLA